MNKYIGLNSMSMIIAKLNEKFATSIFVENKINDIHNYALSDEEMNEFLLS